MKAGVKQLRPLPNLPRRTMMLFDRGGANSLPCSDASLNGGGLGWGFNPYFTIPSRFATCAASSREWTSNFANTAET